MTLKPTLESDKASGSVLTSSEWNVDALQSARYLQEVISGVNADKIPASALATTLALGSITATSFGAVIATTGNFTGNVLAQTNFNVSGTTTLAAMTATTGSFSGALTASAGLTVSGSVLTANAGLTVAGGSTSLQAMTATTGSFSGTLAVGGQITLSGQTVLTGGTLLDTGQSFTTPAAPAGVVRWTIDGTTVYVPYYLM